MKRIILMLLPVLLLISACKKKEPAQVSPPVASTPSEYFFPLKTGNYWVYQKVDSGAGNAVSYDTIRITSDSVVNFTTYYQISGGTFEGVFDGLYGVSGGNIVILPFNSVYSIGVTQNDTIGQFNDGIANVVVHTGKTDTLINVIAGNFNCLQYIQDYYYPDSMPPPPPATNPRHTYRYFSKGVGITYATIFYASSPSIITMQLISYHIAQ